MTPSRRWTTFDALNDRNYRWLWVGRLASSAAYQMGTVAQGWLVYQLTGSAFALGWVSSGWSISTLLLSLYGGAIADRVQKRDMVLWGRLAMGLNMAMVAVLISTGAIQIWHLAVSSLLSGVLYAFMMPAEHALLSELVDRDTLLNAVSLSFMGMGLMGIFSASLAGYTVEVLGVAGAYYIVAGFYLAALLTLTRIPRTDRGERSPVSVWADLWEGVRYIQSSAVLLSVLGLALAWVLLALPYRTFMPKFAQEVMHMDASGLGTLTAAAGVGALVSSLATASLGNFQGKGKLLLGAGVIVGGALFLYVNTVKVVPVLLYLVLLGAALNACMVATNALLQVNSHDRLRGRVMSVYMMVWGLLPLGTIPAGALVDRTGVPLVISLAGGVLILIFSGVGLLRPLVRRLE